jgi:prephenate dehydrogenase
LAHFQTALAQLEAAMQQGDTTALQQLIQQASDMRSGWSLQAENGCRKVF